MATDGRVERDDRFDDLVSSLVGFYRAWVVQLGLELGLFRHLREAGEHGLTSAELAAASGAATEPVRAWTRAAFAAGLVIAAGAGRWVVDDDVASILLDEHLPEYLGGQFAYTVTASLDYHGMSGFIRTGVPVRERPTRYYLAIEQLTRQDIAVFFSEALAALPDLVADLVGGVDVVDLHCGAGRWLVAMARRFPACRLVGVESEVDSAARATWLAKQNNLLDRIRIETADVDAITHEEAFDLAYFQHAFHDLARPEAALQAAWRALRPGGRLLVLGWCLPDDVADYASLHGQLVAGVALDELYHGARLRTAGEHAEIFRAAGLPAPDVIPLPSDATLLVARKAAR